MNIVKNKIKIKTYHTVGTVSKSNRQIVERGVNGGEKQNDNYITMYHMNLINVSECGDMSLSGLLFR